MTRRNTPFSPEIRERAVQMVFDPLPSARQGLDGLGISSLRCDIGSRDAHHITLGPYSRGLPRHGAGSRVGRDKSRGAAAVWAGSR